MYRTPSIKDAERKCRGAEEVKFCITGPDQHRPKNWQVALRSASFKTEFFQFLASEWSKTSYGDILGGNIIYLGLEGICHCFTSSEGKTMHGQEPALNSFHEEADTRMAFHLDFISQVQEISQVCVRTNDTDVLSICLYHMSQTDSQINLWFDCWLNFT